MGNAILTRRNNSNISIPTGYTVYQFKLHSNGNPDELNKGSGSFVTSSSGSTTDTYYEFTSKPSINTVVGIYNVSGGKGVSSRDLYNTNHTGKYLVPMSDLTMCRYLKSKTTTATNAAEYTYTSYVLEGNPSESNFIGIMNFYSLKFGDDITLSTDENNIIDNLIYYNSGYTKGTLVFSKSI